VIRTELTLVPDPIAKFSDAVPMPLRRSARAGRAAARAPETPAFPTPAAVPAWARANGRAGESDPLFAAGASLALLDACLRRDPPGAGALRSRLALQSAAAAAKILRLSADEATLRDIRFAIGDAGPAARLLALWRHLAARPPSLDGDRLAAAAVALELPLPDASLLAKFLSETAMVGDPVSAAAKAAAMTFAAVPDAPAASTEILAFWTFDLVLALRLRWPRPMPLVGVKILDPSLPSPGARRPRPDDPAWANIAAGAIALAAASALDLAADLSRRADTLSAVAPKLRAKPAQKIVELLLAQDCVSPAEAARQAPMTGRAARRLFDRLVLLGAAREFSGRPTFRLYGL
jgi:hypothetical protein